ncbi:MAG: hypothetical protein EKK59_01315 [Neisseriaceae bacterium]|nr:MAG: hypothetical protein EKK59_01315 [Neisseriaceae bacterium]
MAINTLPNQTCPLCGGLNQCVPAQSGSFDQPCWCTQATFSAELLARVPPEQRQQSCICPRCAAKPAHAGHG